MSLLSFIGVTLGPNLSRRDLKIFLTTLDSSIFCPKLTRVDYVTKVGMKCREGLIPLHPYALKFGNEHLDGEQLHN